MNHARITLFKDETGQVRVMTNNDKILRQMRALALFRDTPLDTLTGAQIRELETAANSDDWAFLHDVIFENKGRLTQYRDIFQQVMGKPAALATGDEIWHASFNPKTNRGIRWGWDQDLDTHEIAVAINIFSFK